MTVLESNLPQLISLSSGVGVAFKVGKDLEQRLTGRFYTPELIGRAMAKYIAERLVVVKGKELRIIDPFCGDGRLVCWLIEELLASEKIPSAGVSVALWDCDRNAVAIAEEAVQSLLSKTATKNHINVIATDSFAQTLQVEGTFDICVTNPPWETIKPDSRELAALDDATKAAYITLLKEKIVRLEKAYPYSKPTRKFSGWGTNLARCGIEASVRLVKRGGHFGIVAPASIFGDQISAPLRAWLLNANHVNTIHHFSAEARLFDDVDQSVVYFVGDREEPSNYCDLANAHIDIVQHQSKSSHTATQTLSLNLKYLESHNYAIGFTCSLGMTLAMPYLVDLPKLGDFESGKFGLIKLGRELDETGIAGKLCQAGTYRFIKGRHVKRYSFDDSATEFLNQEITPPASSNQLRIVWRDVARISATKRMIATLLPAGYVTGNSLNVLTVKMGHERLLKALLAVLNSEIFEAQVRASISTNHLSVGAIRKIRIPDLNDEKYVSEIGNLVECHINSPSKATAECIERAVANWYNLPNDIYENMLVQHEISSQDDVAKIR